MPLAPAARPLDLGAIRPLSAARDGIDVSVTLVSHNGRHYLEPMLPQLYRAADGVKMEVLLVDNVCTDGTAALSGRFPALRVFKNSTRMGFGANQNKAMSHSRGRYILCLNPDVLFDRGPACIRKMVEFMDRRPECGVSGCQVYDRDGQYAYPARRYQTLRVVLARRMSKLFGSKGVIDHYFYRDRPISDTFEADWLSGCFLFMRRETLREVGLFDTRYVMYFEDVDICRRIAAHGWRVLYFGGTAYTHLEQRASKRIFSRDARLHLRSWTRWLARRGYYRHIEHGYPKRPLTVEPAQKPLPHAA